MKKFAYVFLLISILLVFCSCVAEPPESFITPELPDTPETSEVPNVPEISENNQSQNVPVPEKIEKEMCSGSTFQIKDMLIEIMAIEVDEDFGYFETTYKITNLSSQEQTLLPHTYIAVYIDGYSVAYTMLPEYADSWPYYSWETYELSIDLRPNRSWQGTMTIMTDVEWEKVEVEIGYWDIFTYDEDFGTFVYTKQTS